MKQINVKIPKQIIRDINQEIKKGSFTDKSDFMRKAAKYLINDVRKFPDIVLKRLEKQSK